MVNPAGRVKLNCNAAIFCPLDPVIPIDRVTGFPAVTEDGPEGVMVVVCPNKVRGSSKENRRRSFMSPIILFGQSACGGSAPAALVQLFEGWK
jgi:hypothetical protein